MGCCSSSLVDQTANHSSNPDHSAPIPLSLNKSKPFTKAGLIWTSDIPLTQSQLDQKRSVFWETSPSYGGRGEIWQALKAAFSEEDINMARSILEAANIILPTGNPCQGCFDELGNQYEIPMYCIIPPTNLIIEEEEEEEEEEDDASLALSSIIEAKENLERSSAAHHHRSIQSNSPSDHLVPAPDCLQNPYSVIIRLSTDKDLKLMISSENETVGSLKSRIFDCPESDITVDTHILRLIYLGRILKDDMAIIRAGHIGLEHTFTKQNSIKIIKDCIIQALVAKK